MSWSEIPVQLIVTLVIVGFGVFFIVRLMTTTPMFQLISEGFAGVTRGSGEPDSPRTLPEGSQLLNILASRGVNSVPSGVSDASADYK